jgi:hypothetical protein
LPPSLAHLRPARTRSAIIARSSAEFRNKLLTRIPDFWLRSITMPELETCFALERDTNAQPQRRS